MKGTTVRAALLAVLAGAAAGGLLKLLAVDVLRVQGESMEPALHDGSRVVVSKLAYGLVRPLGDSLLLSWDEPREGDVVIFLRDDRLVIKRCAAVGGTPLEYSADSGYTLTAGGRAYPLTEEQYHLMRASDAVPEGTILAIGDNYAVSHDSRNYGFVPVRNVIGRVIGR